MLAVCLNSFAVNLYIHAPDLGANPATNRTVVIQQLSPFLGNNQFYITDSNGDLTITNIVVAAPFNATIKAPPAAITFQFYVTSDAAGTVNVTNYTSVVGIATYPAGQTAPSIQMADSRYARSGISLSNSFYLNSNPSNYFSGSQVTNLVVLVATNAAQTIYSNNASGYLSSIPVAATNQFLTAIPVAATNQFLVTVPTAATNQFVARTALAGSNYLTSVPTAATNLFMLGLTATNSFDPTNSAANIYSAILSSNYVNSAVTNGVIFNNRLVAASNGIVALIPATNGYITAGNIPIVATNQFATTNYVNSATNGFISGVPIAATNLFVLTNDTTWFASKGVTNRTAQQVIINNNAITNGYFTNLTGIAPAGNWLAIGTNGLGNPNVTNLTAAQIAKLANAITNFQDAISVTGAVTATSGNVITNGANSVQFNGSSVDISADFGSRELYTSTGNKSIRWGNWRLIYTNGVAEKTAIDWQNGLLYYNSVISIDWFNRQLRDSAENVVANWTNGFTVVLGSFNGDGSGLTNIPYSGLSDSARASVTNASSGIYIRTLNGIGTNTTLTNATINNSIQRWNTNYYGAYSNSVYLGSTNIDVLASGGAIRFPNGDIISELTSTSTSGESGVVVGLANGAPLYEKFSFIAGATNDIAAISASWIEGAAILGGANNKIKVGGNYSTIAAGVTNQIGADYAFIAGGSNNYTDGRYSFVSGVDNRVLGNGGVAMGNRAQSSFNGTFVWNGWVGYSAASFSDTGTNQFLINSVGGVGINTNNPRGYALNVYGAVNATNLNINGVGVWTTNSLIPAYLATNVVSGIFITNAYYFGGLATNVNGIGITNLCFTNLNQNGLAQVTNLINSLYATNILPTSNSLLSTMSDYIQTATNQFKPTVTNIVSSRLNGVTTNLQFGYGTTTTNTFYITNGLIMRITTP